MRKGYSIFIRVIHFIGDILLINFAFLTSYLLTMDGNLIEGLNDNYKSLFSVYNLAWILVVYIIDVYNISRFSNINQLLLKLFKSIILHSAIVGAFVFSIKGYAYSKEHLVTTYILMSTLITLWHFSYVWALRIYRKMGYNYRKVVIVGANSAGLDIYNYLQSNSYHGYQLEAIFDDDLLGTFDPNIIKGPIDYFPEYIKTHRVDEVFCALPLTNSKTIKELMSLADNNLIRFKLVPDFSGFYNKKAEIDYHDEVPILSIRKEPLEDILNRAFKRLFDILFSSLVILVVFPIIFPFIAFLIKITSSGPVFFIQKRNGRDNKEFYCYKFRTMKVNKESDYKQAEIGDSRITSIGLFLRKTNLDELPQFLNVLLGNMSVVGPRPHMLQHTEEYSRIIDKFMVRQLVKPGITGWAQVKGFRGCTKETRRMLKRVRYDVWYIENWSIVLDLKIILLTVLSMIKGDKNAF